MSDLIDPTILNADTTDLSAYTNTNFTIIFKGTHTSTGVIARKSWKQVEGPDTKGLNTYRANISVSTTVGTSLASAERIMNVDGFSNISMMFAIDRKTGDTVVY